MTRAETMKRLTQRRDLWRRMLAEARALEEALADPEADPTPALVVMGRREGVTAALTALGDPAPEERAGIDPALTALDDEIVSLMEEVESLDKESGVRLARAMESVAREMDSLRGGQKMATGYGDQKKALFARYFSKKL